MYKNYPKILGSIDAETKLVFAGNQDLSLYDKIWQAHLCEGGKGDDLEEDDDPVEQFHALNIMKRTTGAEAWVSYLEDRMGCFTLRNSAQFSVYAYPYTPEFDDWAFPYKAQRRSLQ